MTPSISTGIQTAFDEFANPARRPEILKWHEQQMPFLDMAARLGIKFEPDLSDAIAKLTPEQVKVIREAMVASLESDGMVMPIDCDLQELPAAIVVTPAVVNDRPYAKVTAGK